MSAPAPRLRILHLHSSFAPGDGTMRSVQVINAVGRGCAHDIVTAISGETGAAQAIDRGIVVDCDTDFPRLTGRVTPARLQRLARAMLGYDLVLTYGYGAIDAAMAHTVFGGHLPLPPLVHHEDVAAGRNRMQDWYRRIALGRAAALVVPSRQLETTAIDDWHQPRGRVKRIAYAIRTSAYAAKPRRDALPRVIKRDREFWLGAFAERTPASGLMQLVRALADLPEAWQLVILGEHAERNAIREEAGRLDLGHRVHWPGAVREPGKMIGLFDVFAAVPDGAQSPIPILQAMAAGVAVVATDVDEVGVLLTPENRPFIVAASDEGGFAAALRTLAEAPALRAQLGAANRSLARSAYDEAAMVAACRAVYGAALGRNSFP